MKGKLAEDVFQNIEDKLENGQPLTEEDLVPLTLCPLMGGELSQKQRFDKAFRIVRNASESIPNLNIIEAVLYTMATKFLTTEELQNLKEGIKMTELGTMIYNDGIAQGIAQGIEQTLLRAIKTKLEKNKSTEVMAEELEITVEEVEKCLELLKNGSKAPQS